MGLSVSAHAFQPPSVGIWVNTPGHLADRLPKIAAFAGGMFSDVFVPGAASVADMERIRAQSRPNGTKLRAQLWTVPGSLTAAQYAAQVLADFERLRPGVVELNIEQPGDAKLAPYITESVAAIRASRPKLKLRVNVGAYKGFGLTGLGFAGDPNLYACEQCYYGDMSPVQADEALANLLAFGVPSDRTSICYGAAGPIGWLEGGGPWRTQRHGTLGTLYYNGALVRRLKSGLVFTDDLLVEVGLL